ncbi:hypothetical protein DEO72_LG2g1032 [Vigna unguiculata]|uniref:Uncharacterized protein n=1 Tax=Vigna unguiculata TaxID=3917 RepID=A0A4D6KVD6_VIGUN|nr:hypothetical protein DEO72_LG2g1032 [Vigna unguiculata]
MKRTLNTTSAVALAQAKKSSLGESLSRSGESVSPRRDTNSGKRENQGELSLRLGWFAQTRSLSRSSDPNSPRRDFAQEQRCVFWCFRSGECHSPRRKYQVTNLFLHAMSQEKAEKRRGRSCEVQGVFPGVWVAERRKIKKLELFGSLQF